MKKLFSTYYSKLVNPSDRLLVAVSGGLDSVVLLHLLKKHAMNDLAIVHCNFQLRGKESDEDEKFVRQLAEMYDLPLFCKRFDTKREQKKSKQSTQMIARKLRYDYFSEILENEHYDYVAVAHHADDQVETFFINLLRGAGVKGLRGMLPKREKIIRPLLKFSRQEISDYANLHNLKHREDQSNTSDDYLRNKIRHHLIPCLETLEPSAKSAVLQSMDNLQDVEHHSLQSLETLQNCGFSATQIRNMQQTVGENSGKKFTSKTHRATTHNGQLWIEQITDLSEKNNVNSYQIKLVERADFQLDTNPETAQLDFEKLQFPLTLRHWKNGDFFYPFGQRGKQKLSDFFINEKLSRFEKERVWLLCSGNDIVWIVGYRIDNRYKISSKTRKILVISRPHLPS